MDYRVKNMTGLKYGRLTGLEYVETKKDGAYWLFRCDCGNEKVINASVVRLGRVHSCGCFAKERLRATFKKHGMAKTKTYDAWISIKQRCLNPKSASYHNYGGRGITISDEWLSFEKFLEDMGEAPEGFSIERIDNDKGYFKENCKWATREEQNLNKRYVNKTTGMRNISYSKRDESYLVGIMRNGKRHRKSFKSLEAAIAWRDDMLKNLSS